VTPLDEGGNEVGGVSDICDEVVIRSAGLGNVLYVEPREVYLHIQEEMSVTCECIDWQILTPDHTKCNTEH
jgi:hypothetical protein